jgi:hypothetical protein
MMKMVLSLMLLLPATVRAAGHLNVPPMDPGAILEMLEVALVTINYDA